MDFLQEINIIERVKEELQSCNATKNNNNNLIIILNSSIYISPEYYGGAAATAHIHAAHYIQEFGEWKRERRNANNNNRL